MVIVTIPNQDKTIKFKNCQVDFNIQFIVTDFYFLFLSLSFTCSLALCSSVDGDKYDKCIELKTMFV